MIYKTFISCVGTRFEALADLDKASDVSGIGHDDSDYDWFFSSDDASPSSPEGDPSTTPQPGGRRRRRAVSSSDNSYSLVFCLFILTYILTSIISLVIALCERLITQHESWT